MALDAPRKIFVDLAPLSADGSNGGAARFVLRLLRELSHRDDTHAYRALVKPDLATVVAPLRGLSFDVEILGEAILEPRRLRRELRRLPAPVARLFPDRAALRRRGANVLFSPLFTALFHEPGLPHVAIAYDFQELRHPEFFDEKELERRRSFRRDLKRADRVVAISDATRRDAVEKTGLDPGCVTVLPPVVGPARRPLPPAEQSRLLAPLGLRTGGFALYPANFWPHKNHERLLAAFARARRHQPEMTLVLCGALDGPRRRLAALAESRGLAGVIRVLPFLSDDEVTALLGGARFLVYPSLSEGFGIPVLEAMALGTPVACSDIPALREVAGDAARFFEPREEDSIAAALELLWESASTRMTLREDGLARAARYAPLDVVGEYHRLLSV